MCAAPAAPRVDLSTSALEAQLATGLLNDFFFADFFFAVLTPSRVPEVWSDHAARVLVRSMKQLVREGHKSTSADVRARLRSTVARLIDGAVMDPDDRWRHWVDEGGLDRADLEDYVVDRALDAYPTIQMIYRRRIHATRTIQRIYNDHMFRPGHRGAQRAQGRFADVALAEGRRHARDHQ